MTSLAYRFYYPDFEDSTFVPTHVRVQIFAGPDADHRACAGTLIFRSEEVEDFVRRLVAAGFEQARP